MSTTLLQQATIVHTAVTNDLHDVLIGDVLITDGIIAEVGPAITTPADEMVDLRDHLLLAAAVEPHAHLDKAFLAEHAENVTGDLLGAIDAMISLGGKIDEADIVDRAERAARLMAANGYVAVRTHADTTTWSGLRNTQALVEVRRRVADVIDVEIVALCGSPVVGVAGADHRALLRDALAAGADLVGGCPHLEDDGDIEASTDVFLEIAVEAGVGVDLHTDETLDSTVLGLEYLARQVLAGFPHSVTASHCVSLGQQTAAQQQRVAELVAAAGIGVVTLPHTNLWLGGRDQQPVPRGLTAVGALRAAGVAVAAGADNLQDPFNPMGRACPFETAGLMVLVAHDLIDTAWRAVSSDVRRVVGLGGGSIEPGQVADLLAVRASTLRSAIAEGPPGRRVWRRGVETTPRS
ncbi:MAG TPA: amidohydrolase family protein [Ilumatobacteraceae bacterium]|nr:amidohydrolase family protein [Ilumatobacteraceae bacterium]